MTLGVRIIGAAGAGVLFATSFPPYDVPFLLPLGIAALLALLTDVTPRHAAYVGAACGAVYFGGTLFWLARIFGPGAVSLIAIETAYVMMFAALYVWLRRWLPRVPAWLDAAIAWTALEYCRSEVFPLSFGWMGLGYGVVNAPILASCASCLGSYGLTFGIVALGSILHVAARGGSGAWLRCACLLGAWAGLLVFPSPRPAPSRPITIRLVQAGAEETDTMLRLSRGAGRADIIVWPEYSFVRDPTLNRQEWKKLEHTAKETRAVLVFGGEDQSGFTDFRKYRNTAFVIGPDGRLLGRHVKNHTVHLFSDGVPGRDARAISSPAGRLGVAICFDMDYPDVARRLAGDGAEVFVVPNMDPAEWGSAQRAQHRLMFQMRAVECGRWLARADAAGGTSVVAPDGRETARVSTSGPAVLEARAGREMGLTLFANGGWRFPQACLLALALLSLRAMSRRPR